MMSFWNLVPLPQVAGVDLVDYVFELGGHAVGKDEVAVSLQLAQVVGDRRAVELAAVVGRLIDEHIEPGRLETLDDALDGALAEVVAAALHHQAVDADAAGVLGDDLARDEVLAGVVGVHDGADEVLWHVAEVGEQLLGVLGQAVATVAKARVVVEVADARVERDALDDLPGVQPLGLGIGVKLVEVRDAQRQVGVREELDGLGFGGAHDENGGGLARVLVGAGLESGGEGASCGLEGRALPSAFWFCLIPGALEFGYAHHNSGGAQVVRKSTSLAKELGREDDTELRVACRDPLGVADRDRGLDDDGPTKPQPHQLVQHRLD